MSTWRESDADRSAARGFDMRRIDLPHQRHVAVEIDRKAACI
jgi:hypothetical protein